MMLGVETDGKVRKKEMKRDREEEREKEKSKERDSGEVKIKRW